MCHYRCWFSHSSLLGEWGWQRSNTQQFYFPTVPIQEHIGIHEQSYKQLGVLSSLSSHTSCYSREAQCGYLKCQLAATADYTSSLEWSIIKEIKKTCVFFKMESSMWKLDFSLPKKSSPFPGSLQKSSTVKKNLDGTTDIAWQKGWQ